MEYLQYYKNNFGKEDVNSCFKPCYKWNTFNTKRRNYEITWSCGSFKPCYKWNTFNTLDLYKDIEFMVNRFTF